MAKKQKETATLLGSKFVSGDFFFPHGNTWILFGDFKRGKKIA
jgi:hypothetical protein